MVRQAHRDILKQKTLQNSEAFFYNLLIVSLNYFLFFKFSSAAFIISKWELTSGAVV